MQLVLIALLALQGEQELDKLELPMSTTDERLAEKLKGRADLKSLNLYFCRKITDAGIVHLKELTKLETLNLYNTRITDAGLAHLKGLVNLVKLDLNSCSRITDAGLVHLKGFTNLKLLGLPYTKITDAGLVHLKGLTNLKALALVGTKVTVAEFKSLRESLPECRIQR
jgi:Leucine-rich repeat (LRR) protein